MDSRGRAVSIPRVLAGVRDPTGDGRVGLQPLRRSGLRIHARGVAAVGGAVAGVCPATGPGCAPPAPAAHTAAIHRRGAACARTSMHEQWRFSTRALAALGRLCPELQRVALEALKRDPRWDEWGYGDGQS